MKLAYQKMNIVLLIVLFLVSLISGLSSYDVNNIQVYLIAIGIIQSIISLWTIIIGSVIVTSEFGWGTIRLLLIRPQGRLKILYSKYLTMVIYTFLMYLLCLFVYKIILMIAGEGYAKQVWDKLYLAFLFGFIESIIYGTIAFMISSLFKTSVMSIGISIFLLFPVKWVLNILSIKKWWAKYLLFTNTDLSMYYNLTFMSSIRGDIVPAEVVPFSKDMSMPFSIVVILVYFIVFHIISSLFFQRRDIT